MSNYKNTSHDPPGHQMGQREEDESTADVEEIVGGQTHHQEVEAPLASSEAEHQDADGVADEADAEHDQLKIYRHFTIVLHTSYDL